MDAIRGIRSGRPARLLLGAVVVLLLLVLATGAAAATATWTLQTPETSPPARYGAALAADANSDVILFGGNGATLTLDDTWVWDGEGWTETAMAAQPPRRSGAVAALDANGDLVLFGGIDPSSLPPAFLDDTWRWDGSMWTEASPATSPSARYGAGLAVDANGKLVLFGGQDESGNLADTWLWDGETWTEASPTTSPPARVNFGMAATAGGQVILFGGSTPGGDLGDTWIWDGDDWSEALPASSPSARAGVAMSTHGDGVILFGGAAGFGFVADTWVWDGTSWADVSPSPSPSARVNANMAATPSGALLFGGFAPGGALAETWIFASASDTAAPTIVTPGDISVDATAPDGAVVTYVVSATDDVDPAPVLACVPPSGERFPIGNTTVSCRAEDASGNVATASFVVSVKGGHEQLADLAVLVESYELGTLGRSLEQRLETVARMLDEGKTTSACQILESFTREASAQAGKALTVEEAAALTDAARRIGAVIGC